VARLVGYRQPSHFARTFRRRYGVSPAVFLAELHRASAAGARATTQESEQSFVGPVTVWQREPGSKESSVAHRNAGFSLDVHRIIAGAVVVEEDHVGATTE
jgi:AraC-like DNA-binding protein